MRRAMDEEDPSMSGSISRTRSLPLSGARREAGNPFWSEKARAEWELARARPVELPRYGGELPVPEDDFDSESRHAVHDQASEDTPGRARREVAESRVKLEKLFITPGSWSVPKASEREERRRMPVRSQGPMEETLLCVFGVFLLIIIIILHHLRPCLDAGESFASLKKPPNQPLPLP